MCVLGISNTHTKWDYKCSEFSSPQKLQSGALCNVKHDSNGQGHGLPLGAAVLHMVYKTIGHRAHTENTTNNSSPILESKYY